ncbi:MAG: hypothetical protein JKY46_08980 [Robiginitomaculum sp.]|nr:hypothetical protein [Robiginitomaculum sp.]
MILRSITKHVKDQNWFAVGLDFFIVVAGILIAFQITNWNERRQEFHKQQLIETRLQSDFDVIEDALTIAISEHDGLVVALEVLRTSLKRGKVRPEDEAAIKLALRNGFQYWHFSHRSGTFIELLSSGRLDLISDEESRLTLIRYDRVSQETRFNLEQIRNNLHPDVPKFLLYRKLGRLMRGENGQIIFSPIVEYDIEGMAADKEFVSVVDQMFEMQTWVQSNMNSLLEELYIVIEILNRPPD